MARPRKDTSPPKKPLVKPLEVVKYGHPALRSKGKKIEKIDDSIRALAVEMIVTMDEEDGCGLAAHQVGRALQLAAGRVPRVRGPWTGAGIRRGTGGERP